MAKDKKLVEGKYPERVRPQIQRNRCGKCLHANVHTGEPAPERKRPCRGLCTGSCMGNTWRIERVTGKTLCQTDFRDPVL